MASDNSHDDQWEDLVRRLGGDAEQARSEPLSESPTFEVGGRTTGPRDYSVADEEIEDFQHPNPKPIATGNPRTLLSWVAVIGAVVVWLLAGLLGIQLAWWVSIATIGAFLAGAISLFFLIPQSRGHDGPDEENDYGSGAKL